MSSVRRGLLNNCISNRCCLYFKFTRPNPISSVAKKSIYFKSRINLSNPVHVINGLIKCKQRQISFLTSGVAVAVNAIIGTYSEQNIALMFIITNQQIMQASLESTDDVCVSVPIGGSYTPC